jgi:hypothetical protein
LSAPVDIEPLVASLPDQAPEAVQEVVFVETQARVELPPLVTVLGLAIKLTVGRERSRRPSRIVRRCGAAALPLAPTQVRV